MKQVLPNETRYCLQRQKITKFQSILALVQNRNLQMNDISSEWFQSVRLKSARIDWACRFKLADSSLNSHQTTLVPRPALCPTIPETIIMSSNIILQLLGSVIFWRVSCLPHFAWKDSGLPRKDSGLTRICSGISRKDSGLSRNNRGSCPAVIQSRFEQDSKPST